MNKTTNTHTTHKQCHNTKQNKKKTGNTMERTNKKHPQQQRGTQHQHKTIKKMKMKQNTPNPQQLF